MSPEQEAICRAIDQRARDQAVVAALAARTERRVAWTGNIVVSAPLFGTLKAKRC